MIYYTWQRTTIKETLIRISYQTWVSRRETPGLPEKCWHSWPLPAQQQPATVSSWTTRKQKNSVTCRKPHRLRLNFKQTLTAVTLGAFCHSNRRVSPFLWICHLSLPHILSVCSFGWLRLHYRKSLLVCRCMFAYLLLRCVIREQRYIHLWVMQGCVR